MNRKKFKVAFICIALILLIVILYSGLRILESTVFLKQQEGDAVATKTIVRDGVKYYPRQDIMVMMVLGVDREGKAEAGEPNHGYAVDMVTLMVFDEQTQECTLVCLNRDTMLEMPALNEYGREVGTYYGQLALSHTYGTGVEDSCENTRKTVSNFLYGITIDHYYAMNMDAIALLNDAVGGVTVTVTDDFSQVDRTIQPGEMTLNGQQAVTFVQSRRNVGSQLNISRMERQKEYMKGFVAALQTKLGQSLGATIQIYEEVSDYVVTDCSGTVLNRLLEDYGDYTLGEVISLPGENVLGEEHYEFYVDEEKMDALILELFYAPVD